MNKKMSKALAVALSAAMAASAFAIGTGSAFAAPTAETAKATLAAAMSRPLYLYNTDGKTAVDLKTALNPSNADILGKNGDTTDDVTFKTKDGATIDAAIPDLSSDSDLEFEKVSGDAAEVDNGKITAVAGAEGDVTVAIKNLTITDTDGDKYEVDPIDVTVKVVDPDDISEAVWSTSSGTEKASLSHNVVDSVNVGDSVYLDEMTQSAPQTRGKFATQQYKAMPVVAQPTKGAIEKQSADDFEIAPNTTTTSYATFKAQQPGSGTVNYYPSNVNASKEPSAEASAELTVKGVYNDVTDIAKQKDGTYTVTAGGTDYEGLTAADLAAGEFTLASTVKTIASSDSAVTGTGIIKVDTKLGTVEPQAALNVYGVEIEKVAPKGKTAVNVYSDVNAKTKENIPTTIGTIDTTGTVTVGSTTTANNYDTIAISTIKADNVTVNTNKAEINAITKKNTAGTVTTNTEKGIQLPALTGYKLAINTDTTVASIANAQASTIASAATLTVSGAAEFEAAVTGAGTIAIAPASLTIVGDSSTKDTFTLALTEVTAGETAFKTTSRSVKKGDYTANTTATSGTTGLNSLASIKTPGYTAVADGNGNAVIDKTIVAGGVKDATPGAVYDEKNNVYKLEINDDEPTTLALQPIYADSLSKDQTVKWTLKKTASDNITLNNQTATSGDRIITNSGLTATVIGDYQKNYSDRNKFTVTATMGSTTITYDITIVNEKSTPTTDFSLSLGANYVQPGETMDVYATPNGNQKLQAVTFSSSDESVATVGTASAVGNSFKAVVSGHKNGTATIMAVATLQNGQKITKTIDVSVTDTPVLAYVDGKLVGPTDMIDVAQSTSKDVTFFSVNGKTIDSFNYVTGNGKVIGTNTLNVWNGTSGAYQVYAAGKVGEATGIYVNNQKVFMAKVTERPFTSDTTMNVNLPVGKTYSFKISLEDKSAPFTFSTANGTALSTSYNKAYYPDANGDYICTIKAEKAVGGVGVYVNIAGVNYKVFTAVTQ